MNKAIITSFAFLLLFGISFVTAESVNDDGVYYYKEYQVNEGYVGTEPNQMNQGQNNQYNCGSGGCYNQYNESTPYSCGEGCHYNYKNYMPCPHKRYVTMTYVDKIQNCQTCTTYNPYYSY